jgi:SAM-dependent methyltransferase
MPTDRIQSEYFDFADRERYEWTVAGPGFSDTEDELLAPLRPLVEPPLLEIGCGEGNNLYRLAGTGLHVGVDFFSPKVAFAQQVVEGADFTAADAAALPFADATFQTVFIRDLLHHVPDPHAAMAEAMRVLRPGGRFILIEPNGHNPMVNLQSRLVPAERHARDYSIERVDQLMRAEPLGEIVVSTAHPLPLRRLVFHYKMGLPSLGRRPFARDTLAGLERLLARVIPPARWEHVVATARKHVVRPAAR